MTITPTYLRQKRTVMARQSIETLIEESSLTLAEYLREGRTRTDLLKHLATLIVELRSRFTLADGRTDWGGRTPKYRDAMGEIYRRAHVPRELEDTIRAALRYHVGNLLRAKVGKEELADVGLTNIAPRARLQKRRDRIDALAASAQEGDVTPDFTRTIIYAHALLELAEEIDLSTYDPVRMGAARLSLDHTVEIASRLRENIVTILASRPSRGSSPKTRGRQPCM